LHQFNETISRQASEERRELSSHLTDVKNILSLLKANYVGSPYLRFTLRPRPLATLNLDPSDPNLWYSELVKRRSSGLEGMQDFYAVAAIPRSIKEFCFRTQLRNVYVLDAPVRAQRSWENRAIDTNQTESEILRYLYNRYPIGTPIEQIDLDLTDIAGVKIPATLISPVINAWYIRSRQHVIASFKGIDTNTQNILSQRISNFWNPPYKTLQEIWRERGIDNFERLIRLSPLERGVVISVKRELASCLEFTDAGFSEKKGSLAGPLVELIDDETNSNNNEFEIPVSPGIPDNGVSPPDKWREQAARWTELEVKLATHLSSRANWGETPLKLGDPRIANLILKRLEFLETGDPLNLNLRDSAELLGLSEEQTKNFEDAGIMDLQGVAYSINHAESAGHLKRQLEEIQSQIVDLGDKEDDEFLQSLRHQSELIESRMLFTSQKADEVRDSFVKTLKKRDAENLDQQLEKIQSQIKALGDTDTANDEILQEIEKQYELIKSRVVSTLEEANRIKDELLKKIDKFIEKGDDQESE